MFRTSAFSTITPKMTGADYIKNKKSILFYNSANNVNNTPKKISSYKMMDLFDAGNYQRQVATGVIPAFNKSALAMNLHSKYDLSKVTVVAPTKTLVNSNKGKGINFDTAIPFYYFYSIDPSGAIFQPC
jgi:hypothetical protein